MPSLLAFLAFLLPILTWSAGLCWRDRRLVRRHGHPDTHRYRGRRPRPACTGPRIDQPPVAHKAHWRSKPEWACKKVIYLASRGCSCRDIEDRFNRRHGAFMTVGHSWVAEYVKAHAQEIAERRRAMRRKPPAFFAVNHTWALDLTFLVDERGFAHAMLGIIDHGSRRLLCLRQLPRKCTLALLGQALKPIYTAPSAEAAAAELDAFEAGVWGRKFPTVVAAWRRAWDRVIPFFAFAPPIRRVIYTTNAIESINARLRKIIKTRGHFPSDDAAAKLIWLALRNITADWGRAAKEWREAMNQFAIAYGDRFIRAAV